MRRGSNLPAVGSYNQTLVLDLIRRSPEGLSRVELAERTGLSPQTLSNVTRRLTNEGLILEAGKVISGPGKPRTLLALDPRSRYAIGVHLDPSVDTIMIVDMSGRVIAQAEHPPGQTQDATRLVAAMAGAVRAIVDRAGIDTDRILGIGVAAPGPVDTASGRLLDPPLLPAWHGVDLTARLLDETGMPTVLEKDVTAAVVGEQWLAYGDEPGDTLFFYYGAGIGAGLTQSGLPVRGRTGNAGDIAHLGVDADGPRCECGARGCLGTSLEPDELLREAGLLEGADRPGSADPRPALDRLRGLAEDGEPRAVAALEQAARRLARGLVQINNLLDVDMAVIGGPVWVRLAPVLRDPLRAALARDTAVRTTGPLRLRDSRGGTDAAAVGAACLLLDRAFTARPTALLITE
ncbi:ROK family transcriptional regulator [Microbacterium sp.]|uniref:ROK family transcriptional regulator n=1 Tax=Microbacterium sp. TaxID=51671 RepID=UPI0039E5F077